MSKLKVTLLVLLLLLVGVRIALPSIIKYKINKTIAAMPDYRGHVGDVDLAIWRGAFSLENLQLKHRNNDMALTVKDIDLGINWRSLLKKAFDVDIAIYSPRLRMLVAKPTEAAKKTKEKGKEAEKRVEQKTGKTLADVLRDMAPFRISSFIIRNGTIRVRQQGENIDQEAKKDEERDDGSENDKENESSQEARVNDLDVTVTNLTNTERLTDNLMAKAKASAKIMNSGKFLMDMKLNPLADKPMFDLNAEIKQLDLPKINPMLRWQTGMDIERGTFDMYAEAAARDGSFKGYVKPVIEDLKVVNFKKDVKKPAKLIKEAAVGAVAWIFKNKKEDELATKVPFSGSFEDPKAGIFTAVIEVLRNAFIQALTPSLDKTVNLGNVKSDKKP